MGDQEIGLDPHGHNQGLTGPVGYFEVADIAKSLEKLIAAGAPACSKRSATSVAAS